MRRWATISEVKMKIWNYEIEQCKIEDLKNKKLNIKN